MALQFRELAPDLKQKINIRYASDIPLVKERYNATVVECSIEDLSEHIVRTSHEQDVKLMVYIRDNDIKAYRRAIRLGVDIVNTRYPRSFIHVLRRLTNKPPNHINRIHNKEKCLDTNPEDCEIP